MDSLTPFLRKFGFVILAAVLVLAAFFIFGVKKRCTFEIKNGHKSVMILRTYKYMSHNKKVAVDSIALGYYDTFQIGKCVNCLGLDSTTLDFDAIALYDSTGTMRFMRSGQLVQFLESKEKEGCGTYVVR
jgi:hypothetical protein